MEVNMALDVTPEELFGVITQSLEYDIKQSTGKSVRADRITPGYSYKKQLQSKMGKEAAVTVTIEEFSPQTGYVARFDSGSGKNWVKYLMEPLDDGQAVGLSYVEEYEGAKTSMNINGAVFNWLLTIPNKRLIKKKFREIEKSIIESRGKSPEELKMESLDYYD